MDVLSIIYPVVDLATLLQAAGWLEDAGYQVLVNVEGGFSAWARDDSLPVEV